MHLVGFTIEIYYDARPYERQIDKETNILEKLLADIFLFFGLCPLSYGHFKT